MTEIVLATGIELDSRGQHAAVPVEKADQAAIVIEMTMTEDQCVYLARIDLEDIDVVEERIRAVAVIEHEIAVLGAALRFEEERQAPLIVQRPAKIRRAWSGLHRHAVNLARPEVPVLAAVDEDVHRQLVHHGWLDRRCARKLAAAETSSRGHACECGRSLQELSP